MFALILIGYLTAVEFYRSENNYQIIYFEDRQNKASCKKNAFVFFVFLFNVLYIRQTYTH